MVFRHERGNQSSYCLVKEFQVNPDPSELDVMVSTGEQVSVASVIDGTHGSGCQGEELTGSQVVY